MVRLVRAATDRNPPSLGGGGCQPNIASCNLPHEHVPVALKYPFSKAAHGSSICRFSCILPQKLPFTPLPSSAWAGTVDGIVANGATVVVPVALDTLSAAPKRVKINIAKSAYTKENDGIPSNERFSQQVKKMPVT